MAVSRQSWLDTASALTAVMLWGLAFPLIRIGLEDFSPVMLAFLRFAVASAFLVGVILLRFTQREILTVLLREWKPLIALGVLYVTVPNVAQNIGLETGTSSIASVIQSSGPVMTLLFAVILLKESMTIMKAVGTLVAVTGTVMLVARHGISLGDEGFTGNLLLLLSATAYGLSWVSAKRMLQRNPPILVITLSIILGTVLLGLVAPFEPDASARFDERSAANLAVLGVFCAGFSSILYLRSLEKQEVSRMAFLIYLMPVFASLFAWVLMSEKVEPWTALCGFVIVAGIAIANRRTTATAVPR
ncbi:MAG: DMT family transporter [Thermoplasmata archaeon]